MKTLLFPTLGYRSADGSDWILPIHGQSLERRADAKVRRYLVQKIGHVMGLRDDEVESDLFRERTWRFMADPVSSRDLEIEFQQRKHQVPAKVRSGHFHSELHLPGDLPPNEWVHYSVNETLGHSVLLDDTGLSVVSDIDDTIRQSQVLNLKELMRNTFLREFRPVPGFPELYQKWAAQGACLHYVTSAPWQLYPELGGFLQDKGFPRGTFHMKYFRWRGKSFFNLFASPTEGKPRAIEPLMRRFPKRKFIFIGDSGEKDPEVYGELARRYPRQLEKIYIRRIVGANNSQSRFGKAFRQLPSNRWMTFEKAADLKL